MVASQLSTILDGLAMLSTLNVKGHWVRQTCLDLLLMEIHQGSQGTFHVYNLQLVIHTSYLQGIVSLHRSSQNHYFK